MSKKIIALTASIGLLGAAAAHAQTPPPTTEPAPPAATAPPATSPSMPTPGARATAPQASNTAFLVQQQPDQVLVSDYMKKSILGANNERIGNVSDLVMSQNGEIVGVVVGVGGFLGIGEKSVALPLSALTRSAEADQLTAPYTREDLEKAPAFVTRAAATTTKTPPANTPQR